MARVEWTDEAIQQLDSIVAYIELFNPTAALRMGERLHALGESLRYSPYRGRPSAHGTRELVTVPPYILRYQIKDDAVAILGVRHSARLAPEELDD